MGTETGNGAEGLTNEAAALADILAWTADGPAWQRDALRRLCTQETLDTADTDALLAICKGDAEGVPSLPHTSATLPPAPPSSAWARFTVL